MLTGQKQEDEYFQRIHLELTFPPKHFFSLCVNVCVVHEHVNYTSMNRPEENIVCHSVLGWEGQGRSLTLKLGYCQQALAVWLPPPPIALGYRLEPQPALCLHAFRDPNSGLDTWEAPTLTH